MPITRAVADALGVVTICLVAALVLVGLFCIVYSFYFRSLVQLSYFSGPWIIRITYIFFSVWWGIGEIIRLNIWRHDGRSLDSWRDNVCKCYIVSNLGFAEPCLFITLIFLLRASLQSSGTLGLKWNVKTAGFLLLYGLPMFILQLAVILIGPEYSRDHNPRLPSYFIQASAFSSSETNTKVAFCTYPLLSTVFLGLFATFLIAYLFWLGGRILHLVINKGLQKRVCTLIFSISGFFLLRVVLLGLTVLSDPGKLVFDAVAFLAFLSLLCCAGVGICMLVYLPVADSLSLRSLERDIEARPGVSEDILSLLTNQSPLEGSLVSGGTPERNSSAWGKCGSISFQAVERDEPSGSGFVELSMFNPDQH
ncbi:Unknown protein [Striga hermonthica]|uniref:Uncharacterized protein n=1 Tax=Striga hermonthica TaxID=68872 RepID=A0A9N7RQB2_STRHE|nr:Unknown protein [Striga hermonthica]